MNCKLGNDHSRTEYPSEVGERLFTIVQDGHWSELAVHCSLFAGPAHSSFVAAYRINVSQAGDLSGYASVLRKEPGTEAMVVVHNTHLSKSQI